MKQQGPITICSKLEPIIDLSNVSSTSNPRDKWHQTYLTRCQVAGDSQRKNSHLLLQAEKSACRNIGEQYNMSVLRMKYGSAFKPVNPTKCNSAHPFSIKNILNLKDDSSETQSEAEINELPSNSLGNEDFLEATTSQVPLVSTLGLPHVDDFSIASVCPPWVFATRYSRFGIPAANYTGSPRRQRKPSKKPKQRPLFSQTQLKQLEEEFVNEKYISKSRRTKLANEINLTEAQVRTWFQNRRTRWRKEIHGSKGSPCCESSPWSPDCAPQEVKIKSNTPTNFMVVRGFCLS